MYFPIISLPSVSPNWLNRFITREYQGFQKGYSEDHIGLHSSFEFHEEQIPCAIRFTIKKPTGRINAFMISPYGTSDIKFSDDSLPIPLSVSAYASDEISEQIRSKQPLKVRANLEDVQYVDVERFYLASNRYRGLDLSSSGIEDDGMWLRATDSNSEYDQRALYETYLMKLNVYGLLSASADVMPEIIRHSIAVKNIDLNWWFLRNSNDWVFTSGRIIRKA